jgi:hypothetical protein
LLIGFLVWVPIRIRIGIGPGIWIWVRHERGSCRAHANQNRHSSIQSVNSRYMLQIATLGRGESRLGSSTGRIAQSASPNGHAIVRRRNSHE